MAILSNSDFNIDAFKASFKDGARGYTFYVYVNNPYASQDAKTRAFTVRSSSIPGKTVEPVVLPWQGYEYKLGGRTTTEDWTVTFNVDVNADVYKDFIKWSNAVHNQTDNMHGNPDDYMQDQQVDQLSAQTGNPIMTAKLIGAWPSTVTPIELAYDNGEVATFDVTFSYQRVEYPGI